MSKAAATPTTAYIDSSVILRHAVADKGALKGLDKLGDTAATSALTRIECFRVLDRWRITKEASEEDVAHAWSVTSAFLRSLKTIPMTSAVVEAASRSFPIALKSLDAIHLASALLLAAKSGPRVVMVTHDVKLGLAATAMGLQVVGT